MNIFSKGWNLISNASKFAGLGDAAYVAASVVAEGSAPIAAALTEAGIATTAGSLLATAALVLEAVVIFTAIAACVVAPALLFDYLLSGSSEAESTVEAVTVADMLSCETNSNQEFTELLTPDVKIICSGSVVESSDAAAVTCA